MTKPATLVTGAPGWVGSRLVETLLAGVPALPARGGAQKPRDVRILVLPGMAVTGLPTSDRLEVARGDLRDPRSLHTFFREAQGATLFHCAGLVHPTRHVRELWEVNVVGTRNLLQAAAAAGVRRAILLSSNSPAGTNPHREHRFDEDSPYRPYMAYGRSKMQMEKVAREMHSKGALDVVILRPTWFYGPNQPERQTAFFRMVRKGTAPIVGDGQNLRSMAYVDNVCQAMMLSEECARASGQTYWVADARPYPMNEIIDTVERLMETEFGLTVAHRRLRLPYLAGELAQLGDMAIQGLGLYAQKIHVLSEMNKTIACSIRKAQSDLGYSPQVELEEGMRRSLAWCRARGIAL